MKGKNRAEKRVVKRGAIKLTKGKVKTDRQIVKHETE